MTRPNANRTPNSFDALNNVGGSHVMTLCIEDFMGHPAFDRFVAKRAPQPVAIMAPEAKIA